MKNPQVSKPHIGDRVVLGTSLIIVGAFNAWAHIIELMKMLGG